MYSTLIKTLPLFFASTAFAFSTSTASAGKLYNCAVDTGCEEFSSKSNGWRKSTQTKNPVVLVHGISGWSSLLGIEYFYGIGDNLMRNGTKLVFQPAVSGNNSHSTRGEQLLNQVELMSSVSGHTQYNFIGHSQGSPTVRYVLGVAPDKVASMTSVGGVNWGTKVADDILAFEEGSDIGNGVATAFYRVFETLSGIIGDIADAGDIEQNAKDAMVSLSTEETLKFNQTFPVGVPSEYCGEGAAEWQQKKLYSFSGTEKVTNVLDFLDLVTGVGQFSFEKNEPNDGLVSACSSHFGKVLRDDYPLNHFDQVNLFAGLVKLGVNPKAIYRLHVNRLKKDGL